MQGLQTIKCASCDMIFMSEADIATCPSCSEQSYEHGTVSTISGCGCDHCLFISTTYISIVFLTRYGLHRLYLELLILVLI